MSTTAAASRGATERIGTLDVVPFPHPQGCRTYLVADPRSRQALALDVHLDLVEDVALRVKEEGWTLPYVADTHTHADHPSGSADLAERFSSTRIAHEAGHHVGVTRHPKDGDTLHLGDETLAVRHAPGHTPDHLVLISDGALFSGDSLFIGGVARTDFLGGDAGQLFDSLQDLLSTLPDDTVVFPGHDYQGRISTTIGAEKAGNAWLQVKDRDAFVKALTANPPPRPANMDDLLRLNKEGVDIPETVTVSDAIAFAKAGGAGSIIDVRTGAEVETERVVGARVIPLDQIGQRADEVRATPAPRLLLCRSGKRAGMAREQLVKAGIGGLSVIEGGIEAWKAAGGDTASGAPSLSMERQVQITAGALTAIGTGLGLLHPAFLVVPAFMGLGLLYSGLTDTCAMTWLLAKMPWNAGSDATGTAGPPAACAASAPPSCAAGEPPSACAAGPPPKSGD